MQSVPVHSCQPSNINSREHFTEAERSTEKKFLTKPGKFDIDGALAGGCLTGGKPGGAKG